MKYMIPEINISKFSEENIVTLSAVGNAQTAMNNMLAESGIEAGNQATAYTTMGDWVSAN